MFRCSSSSLLVGNNVTFSIQYNTQPGENLFVIGSHVHLGGWDLARAKRMTWNNGSIWDVKVGFPIDVFVQYKYFVYNEFNKTHRWEEIENRQLMVNEMEMMVQDDWGVRRTAIDLTEETIELDNETVEVSPKITSEPSNIPTSSIFDTSVKATSPSFALATGSETYNNNRVEIDLIIPTAVAAVTASTIIPPMPQVIPTLTTSKPFAISSLYPPPQACSQLQQPPISPTTFSYNPTTNHLYQQHITTNKDTARILNSTNTLPSLYADA